MFYLIYFLFFIIHTVGSSEPMILALPQVPALLGADS